MPLILEVAGFLSPTQAIDTEEAKEKRYHDTPAANCKDHGILFEERLCSLVLMIVEYNT